MKTLKTEIYYFSGTGNSLAAAKAIAARLGETSLISMVAEPPAREIGGADKKVGFVFPVYYGTLPRRVKDFVEKLAIHPATYTFGVITMASPIGGGGLSVLQKILAKKEVALSYMKAIRMTENYVFMFNPPNVETAKKILAKSDAAIAAAAEEIAAGKRKQRRFIALRFNKLYKNIESLDKPFRVDERCDGCGLCAKICPVRNIKICDGKPAWQGHCEHCVACVNWCHKAAIQYGAKTPKRRRYHHPAIAAAEMMRNNDKD
jgi:Uncharacterized Fe-S center protein